MSPPPASIPPSAEARPERPSERPASTPAPEGRTASMQGERPPAQPGRGAPSWTERLGEASLMAVAVALFAAVPTALRTSGAGGSFPGGLLIGAAVLAPLLVLSLVLARAAGRGFRGLLGGESHRLVALGLAVWIGLAVPALAGLGALLKATTNHRGLGGAVFGVVGAVLVVLAAVLAHRIVGFGRSLAARGVRPAIVAAAGAAIAVIPVVVVAAPLARGQGAAAGDAAASVRAAVVDGAIALVATALCGSIELSGVLRRVARALGVPLAAGLVLAGAARVEWSPPLARAVQAGGGLAATILGALEHWTDRDQDGIGAHFGGADCDEGDPRRHPGAPDLPADGVDQDCDGADAVAPVAAGAASARASAQAPAAGGSASAPGAPATALASAAPSAAASAAPAAPAPGGKPDVILVTLDTVRADRTSAYGYGKETTPRLAELARRGVLFEHAYATGSDTQRALMPLVSGRRYAQTARDRREWPTVLPEVDTLAERMKRAGYATAAVTSFTWLSAERGFAQGFDELETAFSEAHPERSVTGPAAIKSALAILARLGADPRPLFLWVHLFDAHERYVEHPGIHFGKGRSGAYDGEIAFVDQRLGALVDAVQASPRAARTAWIVHGSNGEGFAEHDFVGHGSELYEEVLRVPLVLVAPGLAPGRVGPGAVSVIDVPATVLALGSAPVEGVSGASLLPLAGGEAPKRPVYCRAARRAALVEWPLKLMKVERAKRDRLWLFDLSADPAETRDLSQDRAEDLTRMSAALEALEGADLPR